MANDHHAPNDQAHDPGASHHDESGEIQIYMIMFVFICVLIGGIAREIGKKTKIPYTPMLFTIGMVAGYFIETH